MSVDLVSSFPNIISYYRITLTCLWIRIETHSQLLDGSNDLCNSDGLLLGPVMSRERCRIAQLSDRLQQREVLCQFFIAVYTGTAYIVHCLVLPAMELLSATPKRPLLALRNLFLQNDASKPFLIAFAAAESTTGKSKIDIGSLAKVYRGITRATLSTRTSRIFG